MLALQLLVLLLAVNGAPILAHRLLGRRFARPLDGGLRLGDGAPLFGPSKTLRGLLAAVLAGEGLALALNFAPGFGAAFGLLAMLGDLISSFLKRRLGIAPSGRAPGLDHIPEALLPLLAARALAGAGWGDSGLAFAGFLLLELPLSRLLYRLRIRRRPY